MPWTWLLKVPDESVSAFSFVSPRFPVTHPSLWARWILRQGGVINGIIGVTCEGHRNGVSCAPNDLLHMVEVLRTGWEERYSTCRRWKERDDDREKQEKMLKWYAEKLHMKNAKVNHDVRTLKDFLQIFPPSWLKSSFKLYLNLNVCVWQLSLHFMFTVNLSADGKRFQSLTVGAGIITKTC